MQVNLVLTRDAGPAPERTFGVLVVAGALALQSLERPWVPAPDGAPCGHPETSCLPAGTYDMVLHSTPDHPYTWALVNPLLNVYHEPGDAPPDVGTCRSACLIHSANLVEQLAGCVGVGLARSLLGGEPDIASSAAAFARLKSAVPWVNGHTLTIAQG